MAMTVVYTSWGGGIAHVNRGGVERDYGRDGLGSTTALNDSSQNNPLLAPRGGVPGTIIRVSPGI